MVRQTGAVGADDHVVEDGETGKAAHDLEGAPHSHAADLEGLAAQHRLAGEPRGARVRREHAVQHVEERRLARAIRPDDPDDLALGDRETYLTHRLQATEAP